LHLVKQKVVGAAQQDRGSRLGLGLGDDQELVIRHALLRHALRDETDSKKKERKKKKKKKKKKEVRCRPGPHRWLRTSAYPSMLDSNDSSPSMLLRKHTGGIRTDTRQVGPKHKKKRRTKMKKVPSKQEPEGEGHRGAGGASNALHVVLGHTPHRHGARFHKILQAQVINALQQKKQG
jgi:hypothetical protein